MQSHLNSREPNAVKRMERRSEETAGGPAALPDHLGQRIAVEACDAVFSRSDFDVGRDHLKDKSEEPEEDLVVSLEDQEADLQSSLGRLWSHRLPSGVRR